MLMIQPQLPDPPAGIEKGGKNLVLVLDKSGSMRGEKIDQARRAARHVIDRLRGRDQFTLITYDSKVETFRSELTSADKETRSDAAEYIDSMLAGGSTNIDEALSQALHLARDADGPAYVVFMTDGQPTVGEKNSMKIVANAQQALHRRNAVVQSRRRVTMSTVDCSTSWRASVWGKPPTCGPGRHWMRRSKRSGTASERPP